MRNVFNPKWIIIINTIPTVILFMIYVGAYQIIKSLLSKDSLELWVKFGATLACFGVIHFIYAIILIHKKQSIHVLYGFVTLLIYIPFLYLYGSYANDIIPGSIPRWMIPENIELYAGTFLMPTLAMALFILVVGLTSKHDNPGGNFAVAILIPVSCYVFFQVLFPFLQVVESEFIGHLLIIGIIIGTLFFIFFLSRGVYILSLKRSERWKQYQFAWKITVAIVFPLLGLALSAGSLISPIPQNIFGDFTNSWFFILAVVNGILVCLPNKKQPGYRLVLFIVRSITFPYVIYFFLVFLPYLPLSVLVIIVFGLGFLMLTPLALMVMQSKMTMDDIQYLYQHFSKRLVLILFIIAISILPFTITFSYLGDKKALNTALDYVYEPDFITTIDKPIKKKALERVLTTVSYHKNGRFGMLGSEKMPFLSPYYNWLVLDNLTLSNAKLDLLERIFLGTKIKTQRLTAPITPQNINITGINVNSTFDTEQQAWRSWIDLEITNYDTLSWQNEFTTTFELPEGAWISDYYLWVNGIKKPGILAEKKTATWIYDQITTTRKDPGILYYLAGNKIAFKVFPFLAKETRKTGFEIVHKEATQLTIDGHTLFLGNSTKPLLDKPFTSTDGDITYIPATLKQQLPIVQRKPYFHFVIDVSAEKEKRVNQYIRRVENLLSERLVDRKNVRFTLANAYTKTFDYSNNWEELLLTHHFEGGFYLERSIKEILIHHYFNKDKTYPIIVVLTDDWSNAILPKDFADLKITFPENELFFELDESGILLGHSLLSESKEVIDDALFKAYHKVFAYPNAHSPIAYLPTDNKASIILIPVKQADNQLDISPRSWDGALALHGKWLNYQLNPANADRVWLDLVKKNFKVHIMTPVTSFIVVENKAQEAALKAKQAKTLAAKQSLDLGEDTKRMSEPGLFLIIGLFLLVLIVLRKRLIFKLN